MYAMPLKDTYIKGETIEFSVADDGYDAVCVSFGDTASTMVLSDGAWSFNADSSKLTGRVRYAYLATRGGVTKSVGGGFIRVHALRSKYRDVVDAIEVALQEVATNGKYSISVGEISLTDKTFDEMVKALDYYRGLAEEDEEGYSSVGRVTTIQTRFV